MRILYITSGSENVGTYFRALFWAKYIASTGNQVTLISGHEGPSFKLSVSKIRDGIHIVTFIKTGLKWDYFGYLLRSVLIFLYVLTHDFEVIHVFVGWQPPSFAAICATYLKRLFGYKIKLLCDWDDLWGGPSGIVHEHGTLISALATKLEYLIPKLADRITVCSNFLFCYAVNSGIPEGKISIVYNGSNVDAIKPLSKLNSRKKLGISGNGKLIVYIGQYQSPIVGIMLRYMKSFLHAHKDVRFYILGSLSTVYQRELRDLPAVSYLGKVPHIELSLYFSAADILLLPMADSDAERARFPIRFGDYLASGTPMLVSPQGEVAKLISENKLAYTVDFTDEYSFKNVLAKVLSDPKRGQVGARARDFAERKLSWKHIAQQLIILYETN